MIIVGQAVGGWLPVAGAMAWRYIIMAGHAYVVMPYLHHNAIKVIEAATTNNTQYQYVIIIGSQSYAMPIIRCVKANWY